MATSPVHGARTLGRTWASPLRAADEVRAGFAADAPARLARALGLPVARVAAMTRIAPRTLARRVEQGERLRADESERVLRLASLYERALDLTSGDEDAARHWLSTPKSALGGATPYDVADTEIGAREVERLIEQVMHGVYV